MRIRKRLSANDIGTTGGHQAGILIPKVSKILSFFPQLPADEKNPRMTLAIREKRSGDRWQFNYIYYNNKFFGGTRNEYRLTCMTQYLRAVVATEGDEVEFSRNSDGSIEVDIVRQETERGKLDERGVLVLGGGWVYIDR